MAKSFESLIKALRDRIKRDERKYQEILKSEDRYDHRRVEILKNKSEWTKKTMNRKLIFIQNIGQCLMMKL